MAGSSSAPVNEAQRLFAHAVIKETERVTLPSWENAEPVCNVTRLNYSHVALWRKKEEKSGTCRKKNGSVKLEEQEEVPSGLWGTLKVRQTSGTVGLKHAYYRLLCLYTLKKIKVVYWHPWTFSLHKMFFVVVKCSLLYYDKNKIILGTIQGSSKNPK